MNDGDRPLVLGQDGCGSSSGLRGEKISDEKSKEDVSVPSSCRIASIIDFLPRFFGPVRSSSSIPTSG